MKTTTELFKNRFDISELDDFGAVSDALHAMATRAECTLLLLTDLAECTGQGETRETGAIYSVISEINDIQELVSTYRNHIKNKSTATPCNETRANDGAITNEMIANRVREIANMIEGGTIE